jgi:hypothetical protein
VLAALRAGLSAWDPVLAKLVVGPACRSWLVPTLVGWCWARIRAAARRCARPRARGGEGEGDGEVAADGGTYGACTRRWGSTRTTCTAAGVASSGGRGRASSSAAACPSVIGRHNADVPYHGPSPAYAHGRGGCWRGRGVAARRCTLASWAGGARAAGQTCENASRGCRGLSADVSLRLWCESEWRERKADPECKTNLRAQPPAQLSTSCLLLLLLLLLELMVN